MIPKSKLATFVPPKAPNYSFEWGVNVIHVHGADRTDVVFSHEDSKIQTINVTRLEKAIKGRTIRFKRFMAILDHDNIAAILKDRDIDPKRIKYIMDHPEVLHSPVLFVGKVPDCILIDGTHRMQCHYDMKSKKVKAIVITYRTLERFRVQFWVNGKHVKDTRDSIMRTYEHNKA